MEKNDTANMSLICTQNILKKKRRRWNDLTWKVSEDGESSLLTNLYLALGTDA